MFTGEDRRRFLRRALLAGAMIAPLFIALSWWTSRSFLLRETRFNELDIEVQMPRVIAPGLPVPVRLLTTDTLRMAHRAQLKWIARDAEGQELTRGAADSFGTLDLLLPIHAGTPALLEIRASDGAWGRNAAVTIPYGQIDARVRIAAIAPESSTQKNQVLIAYRTGSIDPQRLNAKCQWIAFDAMGIPLARAATQWEGNLSLVNWSGGDKNEFATRFELRTEFDEPVAEFRYAENAAASSANSMPPLLQITELDPLVGVRVEIRGTEEQRLTAVMFDRAREHARAEVPVGELASMDLDWKAACAPPLFVRLEDAEGQVRALSEVLLPGDDRTNLVITRDREAAQWIIEAENPQSALRRAQSITVFQALPGREPDRFARTLDPRALAYFEAPALHRTQLGFGQLTSIHASAKDRAGILEAREQEELTARRIVFGMGLVLAALCTLIWTYALMSARRQGSQPHGRPWSFALGASLLALIFAIVASQLWWGTPPAEAASTGPDALEADVVPLASFGALQTVSKTSSNSLHAKLMAQITTDANGRATIAPSWLTDGDSVPLQCIAIRADHFATHQELEISAGR